MQECPKFNLPVQQRVKCKNWLGVIWAHISLSMFLHQNVHVALSMCLHRDVWVALSAFLHLGRNIIWFVTLIYKTGPMNIWQCSIFNSLFKPWPSWFVWHMKVHMIKVMKRTKVKVLGYILHPVRLLCRLHSLPQIIGPVHSWFHLNSQGSIQPGCSLEHRTD